MLVKTLAILPTHNDLKLRAEALAKQLQLPLCTLEQKSQYDYLLLLTPGYLGLKKVTGTEEAIYVDFLSKAWAHRRKQISHKKESIARALGLKKGISPRIIDATGGLARDSFILANLGHSMTLLERSPIVHALIQDGIERGKRGIALRPILQKIELIQTDAITYLKNTRADIVYLDPMFPERKKSALPKKEMLIFHDIVGEDTDADALLNAALACATERVVVKRPKLSETIKVSRTPSFSMIGSSCRFDVYLMREPWT